MKRRIFSFIVIVLLSLAVVPTANILLGSIRKPTQDGEPGPQRWNASALYNLDFASSWLSRILYPFGISTDPAQVIIGRNDWLYLGDRHDKTRSVARQGQTSKDIALGRRIGSAGAAWDGWLKTRGVRLYRVMLAPNKDSIYPEYLPDWARPRKPSAADALILGTGGDRYIDLRSELIEAKAQHKEALYYRTDTHWNSLGAAHGFRAFAKQIAMVEPSIRWPLSENIQITRTFSRQGGDLARFIRMDKHLLDDEPVIEVLGKGPVEIVQYDFDSGKVITSGGNHRIGNSKSVLRVASSKALNTKKVLWLRDSFGNALAPFFAATFTEIVQLHWSEALSNGGRRLSEIVEVWQPDYVFVTVIERGALSELFSTLPPE